MIFYLFFFFFLVSCARPLTNIDPYRVPLVSATAVFAEPPIRIFKTILK